jgi:DNA-binding response OmpR family regulator
MARILVANDDPDLVAICQDILEADGHSVLGVVGGSEALKEAHRWSPDAILLDWQMPDMDGTTAIRVLRADSRTASIPILMMSGAEDGPQVAARAGADGFLAKPFDAEELSAAMKVMIAHGVRSAGRSENQKLSLVRRAISVAHCRRPVGGQLNDGERDRAGARRRR